MKTIWKTSAYIKAKHFKNHRKTIEIFKCYLLINKIRLTVQKYKI